MSNDKTGKGWCADLQKGLMSGPNLKKLYFKIRVLEHRHRVPKLLSSSSWLLLLLFLLLLLLLTAIELSLGGSSPYTSADKSNKNIYT
jgi:hypothetical protein